MNRIPIVFASLALGLAALTGTVSAQVPSTTTADGGYSVADPSNPNVSDEGDVRVYGDIATGNTGGEVVGDPAALGNIQSHDDLANSVPPPDLTPDSSGGLSLPPAAAPADGTTTTTETATSPGDTSTTGATTGTTGDTTSAPVSYCGAYGTWYDAQLAYESAGGLGGDPGLVQAVDPDFDGVACEELIVY